MKAHVLTLWLKLKKDKKKTMLMLIIVGILLLIIVWPMEKHVVDTDEKSQGYNENTVSVSGVVSDEVAVYVEYQEKRLKNILSKIQGAGDIEVMITARASKEKIVEKDVEQVLSEVDETDSNGGSRISKESTLKENSLYEGGSSGTKETPYVVKELEPVIEGVVIVSSGANQPQVVDEITCAISVLFDIPVHKIKVVKMDN